MRRSFEIREEGFESSVEDDWQWLDMEDGKWQFRPGGKRRQDNIEWERREREDEGYERGKEMEKLKRRK